METCSVGPLRRAPAPAECGHGGHLKEVTGQIPWLCDHRAQRERLCQTWETITKGPAGGLGTAESGELEAAEGAQEGAGPGAGSSGSLVLRAVVATRWVEWSTLGRQGQVIMDKKKRWWHRGRGGGSGNGGGGYLWAFQGDSSAKRSALPVLLSWRHSGGAGTTSNNREWGGGGLHGAVFLPSTC